MNRLRIFLLSSLFLSAAYLFSWPTATIIYEGAVAFHLAAGVFFAFVALPFILRQIRNGGAAERIAWLLLLAGTALGIVLIFTGAPRSMKWLLYSHIGACMAGGAVLAAAWAGKRGWLFTTAASAAPRYALAILLAAGIA